MTGEMRVRSPPSTFFHPRGSDAPRQLITMTRHRVYPRVKVYQEGKLLRTTTAGSRDQIDEAEVEMNCDVGEKSDVKVTVCVRVDEDGHGSVSLTLDGDLFELSINGKDVNDVYPVGR